MKIPISSLQPFVAYAQIRGIGMHDIWESLGISEEEWQAGQHLIPVEGYNRLLTLMRERTADPYLGIHYGLSLQLTALGIIFQVSRACETIAQGIHYLQEFFQAAFPLVEVKLERAGEHCQLTLQASKAWQRNQEQEMHTLLSVLLLMHREIRYMISESQSSIQVQIIGSKPQASLLRTTIEDAIQLSDGFALRFSSSLLERPLNHLDHMEYVILGFQQTMLELGQQPESFAGRVRTLILNLMGNGNLPGIEEVLGHFPLSKRSFQRKLRSEGLTFRQLMDQLLQQLSKRFLLHRGFSIQEISGILGYSEASAFIHAFQRWHNISPQMWRNVNLGKQNSSSLQ